MHLKDLLYYYILMLKPVCLFITLFRKNSFAQKYAEYRIFCKTKHQGCFKIGTYLKKKDWLVFHQVNFLVT